jgi:nucleoside phosphorylase
MVHLKKIVTAMGVFSIGNGNCRLNEFIAGVGPVSALASVLAVLRDYSPDALLFMGCAGSTDRTCEIGDTVICDGVVGFLGKQRVILNSSPKLVQDALAAMGRLPSVHVGKAFSSDKFISSESERSKISSHGAICVETEGLALAIACLWTAVPWLMIRVITDDARKSDRPTPEDITRRMELITEPICNLLGQICASGYTVSSLDGEEFSR